MYCNEKFLKNKLKIFLKKSLKIKIFQIKKYLKRNIFFDFHFFHFIFEFRIVKLEHLELI